MIIIKSSDAKKKKRTRPNTTLTREQRSRGEADPPRLSPASFFLFFTILVVWKSRYLYSLSHTHKRVLIRGHINRLTALITVFFLLLLLLFVAVMENDKTSRHTILCVL